jgi:cobalt-zinc-cadmium efflux system outer membrane protein
MARSRQLATAFISAGLCLSMLVFHAAGSPSPPPRDYYAGDPQLAQFLQAALDQNPSVREAFARYQAALQRVPQVGSLPDPMLGLTQYLRSPETRVGPQTTMLSLSQQFPWFGKLTNREQVAAREAAAVRESYEARKDEIARQVKRSFYDLSYLDRAAALTREDMALLDQYEKLAESRYAQGIGLQQAVIKLQAEITRDQNRLEMLRSRRVDAEASLNALLERPPRTPIAPIDTLLRPAPAIEEDALCRTGLDHRPEVQAAFLRIERDEGRIQLAHRNYWPDFTLAFGFTNVSDRSDPAGILSPPDQNGKNIYSVGVGFNIPLRRKKYDAALLEAAEDKIGSQAGYQGAVAEMKASVRAIGFRIQTLNEQIALFERTLLPQAEQALRSTEAAYSTGSLGVLDLLDSQRTLLEVRLSLAQFDADLLKAMADMERTIGAPFPEETP